MAVNITLQAVDLIFVSGLVVYFPWTARPQAILGSRPGLSVLIPFITSPNHVQTFHFGGSCHLP